MKRIQRLVPAVLILVMAAPILAAGCGCGAEASLQMPENMDELLAEEIGYSFVNPQQLDTDSDGEIDTWTCLLSIEEIEPGLFEELRYDFAQDGSALAGTITATLDNQALALRSRRRAAIPGPRWPSIR